MKGASVSKSQKLRDKKKLDKIMSKDLKKDQLKGVLASLASMEKTNVNIDTLKLISAKKFDRNQFDKKVRPPKPEDPAILV